MKKVIALLLVLLSVYSGAVAVCGTDTTYRHAGELYQSWKNVYPDYICGVWSTDGGSSNLTFGIRNNEAGEAGKQEILALVEDDSSVSFVYQEFTRNELYQIFQELHIYFEKDIGLVTLGLSDMDNRVIMEILDERQSDEKTHNAVAEIYGKYSYAVKVEYIDAAHVPTAEVGDDTPSQLIPYAHESMMFPLILLLLLACVMAVLLVRRKRMLQTTEGMVVPTADLPSSEEVEQMVKHSQWEIPDDLEKKVMAKIEEIHTDQDLP